MWFETASQVNHASLQVLKNCEPASGSWNARIRMVGYFYNVGWTDGDWYLPTLATYFSEGAEWHGSDRQSSFLEKRFIHGRPNELTGKGIVSGWHFSWTLNGAEGLAHKIFINLLGRPAWARGYEDEASLTEFIEKFFLADPSKYDPRIHPSNLERKGLPQALLEHPENFPAILRGVTL